MPAIPLELISITPLLLACLVVILAAIVQAALGMGYGLAAAPLLALIEPALVPAPTILLGMLSSGLGAWRERDGVVWPEVATGTLGRSLGMLLALWLLQAVSSVEQFKLVFGVLVGAAVLLTVCGWQLRHNPMTLLLMSWISGLMGTITGVGAPPMAIVYQSREPQHARPTLAAFFCAGCALSALGLAVIGWLGTKELMLAATLLPALLLGTWLGRRLSRTADRRYRFALLSIAAAASILLVVQGLS